MKKKVLITGGVVIVVALVLVVAFKPFSKKTGTMSFVTTKVTKGTISNIVTATGTIEAVTSVDVGTQVSGIIDQVLVDFNDIVKKDQVLALIDKTSLSAQLEQSKATVDQAQAQLTYQEATYNRLKTLYEKQLIAQSDYDQALYNYENARASLKNARSSYDRNLVNLNYCTIKSPIDGVVLNRAIEAGQTVAASFNTPTLFTIVNDLTQMEVETSVDEADIGKVKEGQRVEFTVDAYSDMKFDAVVSQVRLEPTTTNNVVTYAVLLSAPNPDKKLMPGMTASATIFVEEKENVLILSGKAIRFTPDATYLTEQMAKMSPDSMRNGIPAGAKPQGIPEGAMAQMPSGSMPQGMPPFGTSNSSGKGPKMIWIKDGKGGIRPQPIKTGVDNGTDVEILTGLNEGDEVVISMDDGTKKTTRQSDNGPGGPMPF